MVQLNQGSNAELPNEREWFENYQNKGVLSQKHNVDLLCIASSQRSLHKNMVLLPQGNMPQGNMPMQIF